MSFFDNDFFQCNPSKPIVIEATLKELPKELVREDKFGLFLRFMKSSGEVVDEIEDDLAPAITIRLEVQKDLEPHWHVVTNREIGNKEISANDRSRLNTFLISDYLDRHFSWGKGSPLKK